MYIREHKLSSILVILSILFLVACDDKKEQQPEKEFVRPIKFITIEKQDNQQLRNYPAIIRAAQSSDLAFQVSGLLKELRVKKAQTIRQGDIIAKLDSGDFQIKVNSAESQYNTAEDEYQRALRLEQQDAIASSTVIQRKSQRDVTKAQLDLAEKALQDTILRAPFNGIIAKTPVNPLENIKAGELIVTILGKGKLEAAINLPANILAHMSAKKNRKNYIVLDAAPQTRIEAKYQEAVLEADVISQTYEIIFSFKAPDDLIILPGMNATMFLSAEDETHDISVPLSAVMSDGNGQYVWVINTDRMTVSKRSISLVESIGDKMLVKKGLAIGETIAGAGASYLSEGMKVRPWTN